ncbi:MAG: YdbH domain-containing protein [Sphingobium sp.]
MDEEQVEEEARRGWLRWLGVGTGTLALVLAALWTQRAPIVENFVGRELNRRGVDARYDLREVGLRTQRIENLVLGDPAAPDLTAQWVEVDIAFTGLTPQVAAVRAGGVRMKAGYRDGVLRLGEIDKFRDPSSTAPFSLPDIDLGLRDARLRLDTDAGAVGLKIEGDGNLQSGFEGKAAAIMPKARFAGCGVSDATAWLDVAMRDGQPTFKGPVRAAALACPDIATTLARPAALIDLRLGKALDRWTGKVRAEAQAARSNGALLAQPRARIAFDGTRSGTAGQAQIATNALSAFGASAERATLEGPWRVGDDGARWRGSLAASRLGYAGKDPLASLRKAGAGTPVGPLAARFADAVRAARADNRLQGAFALTQQKGAGSVALSNMRFDARNGAQAAISDGGSFTLSWPGDGGRSVQWALNGAATVEGGGLPGMAIRLARRAGGGFGGQLFVDPYAAGDARLALEPVRFAATPDGATRFSTVVRLDGPLPGGGVRGLTVPVEGIMRGDGSVLVNRQCFPVTLTSARYAAFSLGATRQTLCPLDGALVAFGRSGVRGGAEIRKLALAGRNGDSPMRLSAERGRLTLRDAAFALSDVDFTIGREGEGVRLAASGLSGRSQGNGLAGDVRQATARIGSVPLVVEQAGGRWTFADGALRLSAALSVRDAHAQARFYPLTVPDFAFLMKASRITATGSLREPKSAVMVARADIAHELTSGRGKADLSVPGVTFGPSLQPDDITPLTRGVIADVRGTMTGEGRIDWTGSKVSSDGRFRTDNMALAAAFGPVSGISGEVRFTDLLGLVSAPGQEVRIATVNPGVEVRDGIVRYRLEEGQKVRIEGGGWPFSGGKLVLLPTTMDFGADVERYMTFRVIGLDAGAFIQAMELKDISATGTFDGLMPLIFNAHGGRVAGGVLVARQQGMPPLLMPEGVLPTIPCDPNLQSGTLSYVGAVSNEQLGTMGRMAFDALKNLQYKCLSILMDGALDGEMVTHVVFNGVNRGRLGDAPQGIARSFVGLPFLFNVRIAAPFRGLLGTAQSLINPTDLVQDSVAEKVQAEIRQGVAVKPVESDSGADKERK